MNASSSFTMRRIAVLLLGGLVVLWGLGDPTVGFAQDSHAGHDHSSHAEEMDHDESVASNTEDEAVEHEDHDHDAHAGDEAGEHEDHSDDAHKEGESQHDEEEDHAGHGHGSESLEGPESHDDHDGHAEEEEGLVLTPEQRERFGITIRSAGPGSLKNEVSLPGEIVFNEDRVAHLVPRVAGIAREVAKTVGDRVRVGEVLAVIESRELADAKAEFLATKARAVLAQRTFERENALRAKQVSSEQDYLEAEQALAEAEIALRSAEQKLHALGLAEEAVAELDHEHDDDITRYEIRSPIDGVVAAKHISLGESLEATSDIFTVVDTSSVWVNLAVYTKNLGAVRAGQEVVLRVDHSGAQTRGEISVVTPFVEESTRSATARVVLDNRDGRWMPGTFVTGFISNTEEMLPIVVPREAVQNIEGREVLFVVHGDSYEMTPVTLGHSDRTNVEILAGLKPGSRYVADGAFQLKATVITSNLGGHAGHGH